MNEGPEEAEEAEEAEEGPGSPARCHNCCTLKYKYEAFPHHLKLFVQVLSENGPQFL